MIWRIQAAQILRPKIIFGIIENHAVWIRYPFAVIGEHVHLVSGIVFFQLSEKHLPEIAACRNGIYDDAKIVHNFSDERVNVCSQADGFEM